MKSHRKVKPLKRPAWAESIDTAAAREGEAINTLKNLTARSTQVRSKMVARKTLAFR